MKQPSFESLVAELEKIVSELDSSIGLEESLKKFERGMELARLAEDRLKKIENEFQQLSAKYSTEESPNDEDYTQNQFDAKLE